MSVNVAAIWSFIKLPWRFWARSTAYETPYYVIFPSTLFLHLFPLKLKTNFHTHTHTHTCRNRKSEHEVLYFYSFNFEEKSGRIKNLRNLYKTFRIWFSLHAYRILQCFIETINILCKIWGFHGDYYEEYRLLGCRNASPPSDLVLFTCPEDGGDTFFRNVGSNQTHTVLHPRRWYSSINILPIRHL
jgi:hypothetical protein